MENTDNFEFWKGLGRLYDATEKLATATEHLRQITESHERRLDKIEVVQQWLAEKEPVAVRAVRKELPPTQPKDPRRDGFATGEEAARFLGLSRAMITKMTADGRIPHKRFGRALRVPWAWLLERQREKGQG